MEQCHWIASYCVGREQHLRMGDVESCAISDEQYLRVARRRRPFTLVNSISGVRDVENCARIGEEHYC